MVTLETLFNPAQRTRLYRAIPMRYSCRAYRAAPSMPDWAALSYAAGRYVLPGARLILMRVGEALFTGTLLSMGRITGCTAIAAVIASTEISRGKMNAGILGEALCLEAVSMGLGCCWVSGTYRKKMLNLPLKPGEALLAVIALGVPEKTTPPDTRRRRSLERLCKGDPSLWPEEPRRAAAAVQAAPSAMNMQPWTIALEGNRFILDASDRAQLDLGIALAHAELALQSPHHWHYASARKDPAAWAEAT